ncbi:MAG: SAM-dependent methyltransferase [Acidobacteria bacterium]|nr:SAM-dependent methyltransferase [Acidobacteriota bacterium]
MATETPLMPILRQEIRVAGGKITFARFMELCLYHPQHGYYNTERVKLGKHGDFYTSAHSGPVFARLLARHFELLWHELGEPDRFDLMEPGPGDGWLAAELLPWIAKRFPEFSPHLHYTAIEQSSVLRARLEDKLAASFGQAGERVRVLDELPDANSEQGGITGCIFANEFFDALPIHMLVWRDGRWLERYVCLEGDGLSWREDATSTRQLVVDSEKHFDPDIPEEVREDGWVAELSPHSEPWILRMSGALARGEILILDYGYMLAEWWLGRFPQGSALAYREHQVVNDLLANPGEQDLTAHVNFSQLMEIGEQSGLRSWNPIPQAQANFLMELGEADEFHDVFADCATDRERQQRALQLKTLILPQGMGTTFQVLQFRKGF